MKTCFKCKSEKQISQFYVHSTMADGHLNKCIECTKNDVKLYAALNPEKVAAYKRAKKQDLRRGRKRNLSAAAKEHAREWRREWVKTDAGKAALRKAHKSHAARNPERESARRKLKTFVAEGRIQRLPCFVCGMSPAEAHHPTYSLPLAVAWLCGEHHRQVHAETKLLETSTNF